MDLVRISLYKDLSGPGFDGWPCPSDIGTTRMPGAIIFGMGYLHRVIIGTSLQILLILSFIASTRGICPIILIFAHFKAWVAMGFQEVFVMKIMLDLMNFCFSRLKTIC